MVWPFKAPLASSETLSVREKKVEQEKAQTTSRDNLLENYSGEYLYGGVNSET